MDALECIFAYELCRKYHESIVVKILCSMIQISYLDQDRLRIQDIHLYDELHSPLVHKIQLDFAIYLLIMCLFSMIYLGYITFKLLITNKSQVIKSAGLLLEFVS